MKGSVYVDTSVLLPAYVPEPLSRTATARLAESGEICVSRLAETEFYSALAKKMRMRELDPAQTQRIADTFDLTHAGCAAFGLLRQRPINIDHG